MQKVVLQIYILSIFLLTTSNGYSANLCKNIFSSANASEEVYLTLSHTLEWMGERNAQKIIQRIDKQLKKGTVTSGQVLRLASDIEKFGRNHSFRWSRILKGDIKSVLVDMAQSRSTEQQVILDLSRILEQRGLLKNQNTKALFFQRWSGPNERKIINWFAFHATVNLSTSFLLGHASFIPIYFPSIKMKIAPELLTTFKTDVESMSAVDAFQKLPQAAKRSIYKQAGYEAAQKIVNVALVIQLVYWILVDVPEEINKAKADAFLDSYDDQMDLFAGVLVDMNQALIENYQNDLQLIQDPVKQKAISAEIQRLQDEINQYSSAS